MSDRTQSKYVSTQLVTSFLLFIGLTVGTAYAQTYGPTTTNPQPAPSASAAAGTSGAVSLKVQTGSQGSYLVDSQGKSLYVFAADTPNNSTCTGACAQVWPPLTVAQGQTAQAQTGVTGNLIGSITRSDGTQQVTYNGQPLYFYTQDQSPGQTNGQAINSFGALWYLVQPNGSPLMSSSAAGTAAGNGTSGTSAGYGAAGTAAGTSANCTYTMDPYGNMIYSGSCAGTAGYNSNCTYSIDQFGNFIYNGNCAGISYNNGYFPGQGHDGHNNNDHDHDHHP